MKPAPAPLDWRNILLLASVHAAALIGIPTYLVLHGLGLAASVICGSLTVLTLFSISAGYHRLFSHRTYEAHPALRFFLLAMGAGAFQNSALAWAADHRRHHARPDTPSDPYSTTRGFWHAHVGWVLRKSEPDIEPVPIGDLERDRLVCWQQRHYALIGVATGVLLPIGLGFASGDPWGGFVLGVALRLVLVYHATFSINSFAHMVGKQPYSDRSSARDSFLTALISMGEGYHNYHHTFPADYRNGVRAHHFDPTKWIVRTLAALRLAKNLRRTSQAVALRARLRTHECRLAVKPLSPAARERLGTLRMAIDRALDRWNALEGVHSRTTAVRRELREVSRELARAYRRWQRAARSLEPTGS